jgi:hypothetical protein
MDWTSSQLRSLVELTRRGTITAVAQALGCTPGGVSQQIAALEKATGVELLHQVVSISCPGTSILSRCWALRVAPTDLHRGTNQVAHDR